MSYTASDDDIARLIMRYREQMSDALDHVQHVCPQYYRAYGEAYALMWVLAGLGIGEDYANGPDLTRRLDAFSGDATAYDVAAQDAGIAINVVPLVDPEPVAHPTLPPITSDEIDNTDVDSLLWVLVDSLPESATYLPHDNTDTEDN